jgi:predicted RNA polymerase sigma factor
VRIAALYTALAQVAGSPIIELNRAVAMGMAFGPQAALPLLDALGTEPSLRDYHLLPAARADMLARAGQEQAAAAAWRDAAALAPSLRERAWFEARALSATPSSPPSS